QLQSINYQAYEAVVITDLDGNIVYANPHLEVITGYKVEEVIGQNLTALKADVQDQNFYEELGNAIASGNSLRGTFTSRRKDGSLYYEEAAIFPIRDPEGQVTHFAALQHDITERVLAEQEREQLISELDAFAH